MQQSYTALEAGLCISRIDLPKPPDQSPERVAADLRHIYMLRMKLILYV